MRNAIHSIYKKTAEAVLPPLSKSQFDEKRVSGSTQLLCCAPSCCALSLLLRRTHTPPAAHEASCACCMHAGRRC
jgi:hypothetical protein